MAPLLPHLAALTGGYVYYTLGTPKDEMLPTCCRILPFCVTPHRALCSVVRQKSAVVGDGVGPLLASCSPPLRYFLWNLTSTATASLLGHRGVLVVKQPFLSEACMVVYRRWGVTPSRPGSLMVSDRALMTDVPGSYPLLTALVASIHLIK